MSFHRLGVGDALDDMNDTLARLDRQIGILDAQWDSSIGTTVPPEFVMDICQTLLEEVVTPFSDLRLEAALDPVNFTITGLIREAGSAGDAIWQSEVLPILLEAIAAKRNKQASMIVPANMKQRVLAVPQFYKRGYIQLRDALQSKSWLLQLGGISDLAVDWLLTASKAVDQVKKWIISGGKAAYNSVVKAVEIIELLITASKVAGVGLLAYWLFFDKKKRGLTSNPGRRRRRR